MTQDHDDALEAVDALVEKYRQHLRRYVADLRERGYDDATITRCARGWQRDFIDMMRVS